MTARPRTRLDRVRSSVGIAQLALQQIEDDLSADDVDQEEIAAILIVDVSGVPLGTVNKLLYGSPRPSARIRKRNADRLLSVSYRDELVADGALVDATGTWRRIQALVAVGWPKARIARALGSAGEGLQLHEHQVLASTARRVGELYDAWWNTDPTNHGVLPSQVARAQRYAADHGWAPPMAWDDDALDDPSAAPHTGEHRALTAAECLDEIVHLASFGLSHHEIAKRLSLSTGRVRSMLGTAP